MKFKKQIFLFSLIATLGVNLHAHEVLPKKSLFNKTLGYISESKLMHAFNSCVTQPMANRLHKIIPIWQAASYNFQELGRKAQIEVGVQDDRMLPVKKVNPSSLYATIGGAAYAESDAIYVNEEKLSKRTYGAQRCGLLHEAVHIKYHDFASDTFFELCALLASSYGAHALIKAIKPKGKFKVVHVLGVLSWNNGSFINKQPIPPFYGTPCGY